ncbi:hypothetical protein [Veillonella criceti]|uniref:Uncharacterized protein n=1 Tax=Veillonella criceti TaxID=103891 RepID=A0A380NKS6_9FIRM|nr:hypothetical protein [Veillonella criceti]SUP42845.1 Uncharacterised protein [Veillonella criceti]
MFKLNHEIKIKLSDIPIPWISKIELFYPDLPQFPIIYIHFECNNKRIIACPVAVSYSITEDSCTAEFLLLSNVSQDENNYIEKIKDELSNRIGLSDKISKTDILLCCNENKDYQRLLDDLWRYIESSYGKYLPYGKFYEEMYSIVRFVAAWQPKTGRQSEMRMLYNFMSAFGEQVALPNKWEHIEFYVLPLLNDILQENFNSFTKFKLLHSTSIKLFNEFFTHSVKIENTIFLGMEKAWGKNKGSFIKEVSEPLYEQKIFNEDEKAVAEALVDAFNRHPWRAAYFISSYINIDKKYASWKKDFFNKFYMAGNKLIGYSEKVIACFIQQGFLNSEAIPIDTWIETFYKYPLGISKKITFLKKFSNMGKLERVIWLASQSNKTNMKTFFDILWCQRFGTTGNKKLRGINPISCYTCNLKNTCVGLNLHLSDIVYFTDDEGTISKDKKVCYINNNIPIKYYQNGALIDEFSGYKLTSKDQLPKNIRTKGTATFKELVFR